MKILPLCTFLIKICLITNSCFTQTFSENFDGSFPPTGWAVFDNGIGTGISWSQNATSFAGAGAAYSNYDCSVSSNSEDWLVTPLVAITAGNSDLSYYHQNPDPTVWGSIYEVYVSTTSQINPAAFIRVDSLNETLVPTSWGLHSVDLSTYIGQSIYIAFVHTQNCGDDYFIDELVVGPTPCLPPSNLATANITATSVDISWTGIAPYGEISVVPAGNMPAGGGIYSTSPATIGGLMGASPYDAYVREICEGGSELLITGVFDGPLIGGQPKAIELYVQDSIPDLSVYAVGSANNGGGTTAPAGEFTFPAISVSAGTYIHITSDSADFVTYFGTSADYVGSVAFINGDDAVELIRDGVVIDVFGVDSVDGTGQSWEYLDGWAYRKDNRGANGGVFVDTNWVYSGINAVDGCTVNSSCGSILPIGTYSGSFAASAWIGPINFVTACPNSLSAFGYTQSGLSVSFSDTNPNPISWFWDFGDGSTSSVQNPTHLYSQAGVYPVCLTLNYPCDTLSYCDTVTVICPPPVAEFGYETDGMNVIFSDSSSNSPTFWHWNMGIGASDTNQNPVREYSCQGNYEVELISGNQCGSDTIRKSINVSIPWVSEIELDQIDELSFDTTLNSTKVLLTFVSSVPDSLAFKHVNVLALEPGTQNSTWVAENLTLVPDIEDDTVFYMLNLENTGFQNGLNIDSLQLGVCVSDSIWTQKNSQNASIFSSIYVDDLESHYGQQDFDTLLSPAFAPTDSILPVYIWDADSQMVDTFFWKRKKKMPVIDLDESTHNSTTTPGYAGDKNACFPAAAANIIEFYDRELAYINSPAAIQSHRNKLKGLSGLMGRMPCMGTKLVPFLSGLMTFIDTYKLSFKVEFQSSLRAGDVPSTIPTWNHKASNANSTVPLASRITKGWIDSKFVGGGMLVFQTYKFVKRGGK